MAKQPLNSNEVSLLSLSFPKVASCLVLSFLGGIVMLVSGQMTA